MRSCVFALVKLVVVESLGILNSGNEIPAEPDISLAQSQGSAIKSSAREVHFH